MPIMAKKPSKHDRHKMPRESFHLPADLHASLSEYQETLDPKPGKSAIIRAALKEYLKARDFWPRQPDE